MSTRRTTLVVVGLVLAFLAPMSTAYALWSRTASATLNVSVAAAGPAAPAISCGTFQRNGVFTITWTNVAGLTYSVHSSTTTNADPAYTQVTGSATSPYEAGVPNGTSYWRVRASNGTGTSGWSNTVQMVRTGNGSPDYQCNPATP